jgi:single-stranded DNA-binding protein
MNGNGIKAQFTSVVAKAPRQATSRTGIKWTKIQSDIPVRREDGSEAVYWVNVSVPGNEGDRYLHLAVGDRIYVEGTLVLNSYTKDGQPIVGLTLLAKKIERLRPAREARESVT